MVFGVNCKKRVQFVKIAQYFCNDDVMFDAGSRDYYIKRCNCT